MGDGIKRPHDRQYDPPATGGGAALSFAPLLARIVIDLSVGDRTPRVRMA